MISFENEEAHNFIPMNPIEKA